VLDALGAAHRRFLAQTGPEFSRPMDLGGRARRPAGPNLARLEARGLAISRERSRDRSTCLMPSRRSLEWRMTAAGLVMVGVLQMFEKSPQRVPAGASRRDFFSAGPTFGNSNAIKEIKSRVLSMGRQRSLVPIARFISSAKGPRSRPLRLRWKVFGQIVERLNRYESPG
jgi:hypothetical protein